MEDFYSFIKSLWVVWMMALFVGIAVWVWLPRNRKRFKNAAEIPLHEDDEPGEPKSGANGPSVNAS